MNAMQQFTEMNEYLGDLAPITVNGAVGAHTTGYFSVGDAHRIVGLMQIGTAGAAGSTIDVTVQEATDADGTGAQNLDGKAPAQIVAADEGGLVAIEIRAEELDITNGYGYLQFTVTVGTNTFTYSLLALGFPLRYAPADISLWTEIVE